MRISSRRLVAINVPKSFASSYPNDNAKSWKSERTHGDIKRELAALDTATCAYEDIDRIIGNDSWTAHKCEECNQNHELLVVFNHEYSDERTVLLCKSCMRAATAALDAVEKSRG